MNRRKFITQAGLITAGAPLVLTARKASAAPLAINTQPFYQTGGYHAAAIGNYYRNNVNTFDYANLSVGYNQLLTYWNTAKLDTVLKPQYNTVTENMLSLYYIPIHNIASALRAYNPAITDGMVGAIYTNLFYNSIINGVDHKVGVLNNVRTNGVASYIQQAAVYAANLSHYRLGTPLPIYPGPNKPQPLTCEASSLGLVGMGIALAVLTVMTDGLDLLVGAGWAAMIYWTGIGTAGWTIVHEAVCNTKAQ